VATNAPHQGLGASFNGISRRHGLPHGRRKTLQKLLRDHDTLFVHPLFQGAIPLVFVRAIRYDHLYISSSSVGETLGDEEFLFM